MGVVSSRTSASTSMSNATIIVGSHLHVLPSSVATSADRRNASDDGSRLYFGRVLLRSARTVIAQSSASIRSSTSVRTCIIHATRANAERAPISAGERDVSRSAPRIQRRSTGLHCRSHDCLPKYCLCGSNRRTSYTGSPNTHYPGLTRSPRTTEPRRPPRVPD